MRRTTAKLMKFPTRASAKFLSMYKKMKAMRRVNAQFEINSMDTLESSFSENEEHEEGEVQEEDEDEEHQNKQSVDRSYNLLRIAAKKRILEGI
ncbi:hypothetical protein INT47_001188 [Mucor saturninus]|uniref:Uncharacterized protein n=1 Tax=Mucor saturninus TaxID=64648 RepID=A0A8H7RMX4_9FUNG|nr:hypothetical protein INT47_001188 [Mucor saturninus]